MAKENEFIETLQKSVQSDVKTKSELEQKREALQRAITEMEANVIKDPKALGNLKKELASIEKEINQKEAERAVETGEIVGKSAAEKDKDKTPVEDDEKKEGIKDEEALSEEEKEKKEAAKQAYHTAMIALHEKRMQTIREQVQNGNLISSQGDYEAELQLEAELYTARDAYLEFGSEDPYTQKRTELIKIEKEAREPIERELRNRAKRFKEIENRIRQIDKREQEINDELLSDNINETQITALQSELKELGAERQKLEVELADIKDNLDKAINIRRERLIARAGLEQKHVETLSYEDKRNYDYQQSKVATMNRDFDQATKMHYQNIKRRIEEREQKIKDINKELKEVPDTDFERKLVLLNELDKETNMLEADRLAKSDLDRGIIPTSQETKKDAKDKAEAEEYRQEEFDKATDEVRTVVKEQKEEIGKEVVENPAVANVEEKEREDTLKAATVAVVVDGPAPGPDTPLEDATQFAVAKCVISGLEDQVRDPNNLEDAQAIVEQDKQIKEAQQELEQVQENIEQKV